MWFSAWELVVLQKYPNYFSPGEWSANKPGKFSEMNQMEMFR